MNLAICSIASGSSGNCYVVMSGNTVLLVDAGISARRIRSGLAALNLVSEDVDGILITHEHSDHIKGLRVITKATEATVYANENTFCGMNIVFPEEKRCCFTTGDCFTIGDIDVRTFPVSHDSGDPVGYSFESGGHRIAIVTDTGIVTEPLLKEMRAAEILVLESNHDESILRMGKYPWFLKQRILGNRGHLSNVAAAEALASVLDDDAQCGDIKARMILLAHLSRENNFPEMAVATMENVLGERGYLTGAVTQLITLSRTEMSPLYTI